MDFPQRAVFFLEEDSSLPAHSKPLMLEAVLFCPILKWMSDKLLADGVQRFFAVSSPRFAQEVRACFPEDADVTISEQHSELLDFLNTPDPVAVFVRAALPMEEAGPGFVYGAAGYELQAVWQEKMTNAVSAAELIPGWVPVFSLETVAELEPLLRERIVRRHIRAGRPGAGPERGVYRPPGHHRPRDHAPARHHPAGGDRRRLRLHHRSQCRGAGLRHRR